MALPRTRRNFRRNALAARNDPATDVRLNITIVVGWPDVKALVVPVRISSAMAIDPNLNAAMAADANFPMTTDGVRSCMEAAWLMFDCHLMQVEARRTERHLHPRRSLSNGIRAVADLVGPRNRCGSIASSSQRSL